MIVNEANFQISFEKERQGKGWKNFEVCHNINIKMRCSVLNNMIKNNQKNGFINCPENLNREIFFT